MQLLRHHIIQMVCASFLYIGCTGENTSSALIERFCSSTVVLPFSELTFIGADSTWMEKAKYVCVVYEDSMSCMYCFASKLALWGIFEEKVKKSFDDFSVCFVIPGQLSDMETLKHIQYYSQYAPPIYLDTDDVFLRENPMIDSSRVLRSFLIDDSGCVLVVGNPTANADISRRMIDEINAQRKKMRKQNDSKE